VAFLDRIALMKLFLIILIVPYILFSLNIKVATYNVQNLFDNVDNGNEYKEYKLNNHNWNSKIFYKKLDNITKVICDLNADIIGLEEIENKNALNILQKSLNRHGCKYRYSAITDKRDSAIQVALLSKYRIKSSKDIKVTNSKFNRDILEVKLDLEPNLTIFVNHWRSHKAKESRRILEAKALMSRIREMPKGSEYIIMGDFNSAYNECEIERTQDLNREICAIDGVLKTFINGRMIKFKDKNISKPYHYNLWQDILPYKRWSHGYFGKRSSLDSIIISPTLNDNKGWRYIKGSFSLFKKAYLFKNSGKYINSWEYKNSKFTGKGYSDHLPIYALFSNGKLDSKHKGIVDSFWSIFTNKKRKDKKIIKPKRVKYIDLKDFTKESEPFILKRACVVFKRGDIAVIKSHKDSLPIMLYKSANGLKEGSCYSLKVYKKKIYFKTEEILDLDIVAKVGKIDKDSYIDKFNINKLDNYRVGDIVRNVEGKFKNGYLFVNKQRVKLYLKRKSKNLLSNGTKLFIKKAQIGYYKGEKELIVYNSKDIKKGN